VYIQPNVQGHAMYLFWVPAPFASISARMYSRNFSLLAFIIPSSASSRSRAPLSPRGSCRIPRGSGLRWIHLGKRLGELLVAVLLPTALSTSGRYSPACRISQCGRGIELLFGCIRQMPLRTCSSLIWSSRKRTSGLDQAVYVQIIRPFKDEVKLF
jgi:hypothetical protein